jgi:hypothetical protein
VQIAQRRIQIEKALTVIKNQQTLIGHHRISGTAKEIEKRQRRTNENPSQTDQGKVGPGEGARQEGVRAGEAEGLELVERGEPEEYPGGTRESYGGEGEGGEVQGA